MLEIVGKVNWTELFVSLGGLTGLIAFGKELYKAYMRNKVYSMEEVQKSQLAIYKEMTRVIENTAAQKVLILYLHNGGSQPAVGKPLYSTALYEVNQSEMEPKIATWSKQRVDKQYTQMLVDMINSDNGSVILKTDEMEKGILRDVYKADGITFSRVSHLGSHNPKSFWRSKSKEVGKTWYMSTVFQKTEPITAQERDVIRSAVSHISNILKEQYQYD